MNIRSLAYRLAVNYAVYRTLLACLGVRHPRVHIVANLSDDA